MTSLFLRNACLPCSMYCSRPSGSRLALTALSRTSPRRALRMQANGLVSNLSCGDYALTDLLKIGRE